MLSRLLSTAKIPVRNSAVIWWWEARRVPYNLLVGGAGLASVFGVELIANAIIPPGEDAIEPVVLWLVTIVYALACNVCYTLGWISEIYLFSHAREAGVIYRRKAFLSGLIVSCAVPTLPLWLWILAWFFRKRLG